MSGELMPYVGPRPFEREHEKIFFARDREANMLVSLIMSHCDVLLYSQSGAGKTSLVKAKLIPMLEAEDFEVLQPPARVQGQLHGFEANAVKNIYVFHALMNWEGEDADPKRIAQTSLADFLKERPHQIDTEGMPSPRIAIFDQFEELFTSHPERWEERPAFFSQVREALDQDRMLRAVFVMREDYIAALDPYVSILPEKLSTRFHLERMREKSALLAIKEPLKNTTRHFADGVAEALVDQLRHIEIQTPDGGTIEGKEEFVELVQLQVVCQSLWNQLKPEDSEIKTEHLAVADLDKALLTFYEKSLRLAADETGVPEGKIRHWFERALITPAGTRGTVFRDKVDTEGLPNAAVDVLEKEHIIRGEFRGGGRWYELTHDRFIESIQQSRQRRLEEGVGPESTHQRLEIKAAQWVRQGRRRENLLEEGELGEAQRLLDSPQAADLDVSDNLRVLVAASSDAIGQARLHEETELRRALEESATQQRLRAEEQRKAATRFLAIAWLASACAAAAIVFVFWARKAEYEAEQQRDQANQLRIEADRLRDEVNQLKELSRARELLAKAALNEDRLDLALLLTMEAQRGADSVEPRSQQVLNAKKETAVNVRAELLNELASNSHLRRLSEPSGDELRSIAISKDGNMMASCSGGSIRLWNVGGLFPISPALLGHQGLVYSLDFAPNGKTLASCGDDGTIRLWDPATGKQTSPSWQTSGKLFHVTFNPSGNTLASCGDDGTICLWDLATGNHIALLPRSQKPVYSVAFSPSGNTLASGGADEEITLWDVTKKPAVGKLLGRNPGGIFSLAFSPDGEMLATGGNNGAVMLWNVKTGKSKTLAGAFGGVFALVFSSDGKTLISGSTARPLPIRQWDVSTGTEKHPGLLTGFADRVYSLAFAPNTGWLLSGTETGSIALWDLSDDPPMLSTPWKERLQSGTWVNEPVRVVRFGGEKGSKLAFGTNSSILLFDVTKNTWAPLKESTAAVQCLAFSPKGEAYASGAQDGKIILWDAVTGKPRSEVRTEADSVMDVAFDPDGRALAACASDKEIALWDIVRQKRTAQLIGHEDSVTAVAFSPDGGKLASGGFDHQVIFWDTASGKQNGEPVPTQSGTAGVSALAFSPHGDELASATYDGQIKLWDVAARTLIGESFQLKYAFANSIAFSPDGKMLAAGADDGSVLLWNLESHELIGPIRAKRPGDPIYSLAFSADNKQLATGGLRGVVWEVSLESLWSQARMIVSRDLNEKEREMYLGTGPPHKISLCGLAMEAHCSALDGNYGEARDAFAEATKLAAETKDVDLNNMVGWLGSLDGFAQVVLPAAKNAVNFAAPDEKGFYRDSLGLARALTGDIPGAIADFEAYVDWAKDIEAQSKNRQKREKWLVELKAGHNPFDDRATLKALLLE